MRVLEAKESQNVGGGFFAMLAAFVAVFTLPKLINDHSSEYGQWGQGMSQQYWDNTYPYDPNSNNCYGPYC